MDYKDVLYILLLIGSLGIIFFLLYKIMIWLSIWLRRFLKFIFFRELKSGILTERGLVNFANILILVFLLLITLSFFGCSPPSGSEDHYEIENLSGKIAYKFPDTLKNGITYTVPIRIAKKSLSDKFFLHDFQRSHSNFSPFTADSIPLGRIMKVVVKETSEPQKLHIKLVNNSEEQLIDTASYTEWLYDISSLDYGSSTISLSITIINRYKEAKDYEIYHKDINLYATEQQKICIMIKKHYSLSLCAALFLSMLIYRLIPQTQIIQHMNSTDNKTNYWNSGSLAIVIYIITIISLIVFKLFGIDISYAILVFSVSILLYVVIASVSLRDSGKISEKNFFKIMSLVLKKIPPLNFIFKNNGDQQN